jgi:hypothetical protein
VLVSGWLSSNGSALNWQLNPEFSTLSWLRFNGQTAAVFIDDDLLGDRETQSCAFSYGFCGEQMVKDPGLHFSTHPFAIISNSNLYPIAN